MTREQEEILLESLEDYKRHTTHLESKLKEQKEIIKELKQDNINLREQLINLIQANLNSLGTNKKN